MNKETIVTPEAIIPQVENQSFDTFESFYEKIPYEGSLGILALGAMGIMAWRKKRTEIDRASNKNKEEQNA